MISSNTTLRVRYAETDKMGYAYYGNYATYFEVARVEALKKIGISYKELEDRGVMLPVADFSIKYLAPAHYDDELRIEVVIEKMPSVRMVFDYKTFNTNGDLLNTAKTTLVFVDTKSGRPCPPPQDVLDILKPYFTV